VKQENGSSSASNVLAREVIHRCTTACRHGGPLRVRWPWKDEAGIVEDWPDDPQTHMPVGIAVSMGARIELLAPDKSITGTPQSRSGSSDT
jgi:hypothetical protein